MLGIVLRASNIALPYFIITVIPQLDSITVLTYRTCTMGPQRDYIVCPLGKPTVCPVNQWSFSVMSDSAIPWSVAYQAPPSMQFSRQEYSSGLPFPSPGDLPDPGIEPRSPVLQAVTLTSELPGKPWYSMPKVPRLSRHTIQILIQAVCFMTCSFNIYAKEPSS